MSKTLLCVIIVVLVAILFYQSQCNAPVQRDTHVIDSFNTVVKLKDLKYSVDSAGWVANMHAQDAIITELTKSKEDQYDAFKNQVVQLTFQRNKYRIAAGVRDTVSQLQACGEFMHLADSFYTKAVVYEVTIDSLLSATKAQHSTDTATISALMAERETVRKDRDAYKHFMEEAIEDNNKLLIANKRLKKSKWLWFGLGAVAGGSVGRASK